QLSRAVNTKYYDKSFKRFPDETFFKVIAPANSRVSIQQPLAGQQPSSPVVSSLLAQQLVSSPVPSTAVSPSLRKIARPRGPINREYLQASTAAPGAVGTGV